MPHDCLRDAAEDDLAQARMRIGTHHEQIGAQVRGAGENEFADIQLDA